MLPPPPPPSRSPYTCKATTQKNLFKRSLIYSPPCLLLSLTPLQPLGRHIPHSIISRSLCLSSSCLVSSFLWGSLSLSRFFPLDKCTASDITNLQHGDELKLKLYAWWHTVVTQCVWSLWRPALLQAALWLLLEEPLLGSELPPKKDLRQALSVFSSKWIFSSNLISVPSFKIYFWCFSFAITVQQDYFLSSCCNPLQPTPVELFTS